MTKPLQQPDDMGLWRFGIISPLLHRSDHEPTRCKQIQELAQRVFVTPDGKEKRFSPQTLRNWLWRYRTCGIDGLRNKRRKDAHTTSIALSLQNALRELHETQPRWTIMRMLRHMQQNGLWNGYKPSRSALYRFTAAYELGRTLQKESAPVRSFEFPFFGDLWSADFLYGPKVRKATHTQSTYLNAIIDDATRYIVAARFHLAQDTRCLLDDFMLALRRFGVPKRLYTDNGAAFRSQHLRMVAAKLGVSLPHTPPYTPRGRGKIERFFRSVREGFLDGRAICGHRSENVIFRPV
jgi:transposase InsO family protein